MKTLLMIGINQIQWNEFAARNKNKKVSLKVAAKQAGYNFNEAEAHDAIYDCKATLAVWDWINKK